MSMKILRERNNNALRNYMACFKLLRMYRDKLKIHGPNDYCQYVMAERRELLAKSKHVLNTAKILRVNAL